MGKAMQISAVSLLSMLLLGIVMSGNCQESSKVAGEGTHSDSNGLAPPTEITAIQRLLHRIERIEKIADDNVRSSRRRELLADTDMLKDALSERKSDNGGWLQQWSDNVAELHELTDSQLLSTRLFVIALKESKQRNLRFRPSSGLVGSHTHEFPLFMVNGETKTLVGTLDFALLSPEAGGFLDSSKVDKKYSLDHLLEGYQVDSNSSELKFEVVDLNVGLVGFRSDPQINIIWGVSIGFIVRIKAPEHSEYGSYTFSVSFPQVALLAKSIGDVDLQRNLPRAVFVVHNFKDSQTASSAQSAAFWRKFLFYSAIVVASIVLLAGAIVAYFFLEARSSSRR